MFFRKGGDNTRGGAAAARLHAAQDAHRALALEQQHVQLLDEVVRAAHLADLEVHCFFGVFLGELMARTLLGLTLAS